MKFPKESAYLNAFTDSFKINHGLIGKKPENNFDFLNSDTFLCVQGILAFPKFMESIGNELQKLEKNVLYLEERTPITSHFKTEKETIDVLKKNKENIPANGDIVLVGHSLGAVSNFLASMNDEVRSKVKTLISLSPPFGTDPKMAVLPFNDVRKSFKPGSVFPKQLNDLHLDSKTPHHIYTTTDDLLVPYDSQTALTEAPHLKTFSTDSNHHCVYMKYPEIFVPEMIQNINALD